MRFGYWLVKTTSLTFFRLFYGLKVAGLKNIPCTGKVIIASNHRSDFDPPLLGGIVPREVHFFAKEELFQSRWLGPLIRYLNAFPVRRGQLDREALTTCQSVLRQNGALIFFPEGTRAPSDGFLKAKLGIGWIIALTDAPVVPVYIHGSHEKKPSLRKRPRIIVTFGELITIDELKSPDVRGKELYQAIADRVLEHIRDTSLRAFDGRIREKGPIYERDIIEEERLR